MTREERVQPQSAKLTYDDYATFPDDGLRHELIDGVHVVTPSRNLRHQVISGHLYASLHDHLRVHPVGRVFFAPLDVILSTYDVVQPDLLNVSNERGAILQDWVRGAPDLVVEIVSPGSRRVDERTSWTCSSGPTSMSTGSSIPSRRS
jgi:Uma2 family endonuclease